MRRRRSPPTPAAWRCGVAPDVLDVLLGYDRAAIGDRGDRGPGIPYDRFLQFCVDEPETRARLADALHRHRRALVVEARRLGLRPPWMTAAERRK